MNRYIDVDKFVGNLKTDHWGVTNMVEVGIAIGKSVADVVEVRHGEWEKRTFIIFDSEKVGYRCSECNTTWDTTTHFCPNCGAKMDGERK